MNDNVTIGALRRVALWSPQSNYDDTDIIYSTPGFGLELERLRGGAAWLVLGRKGIGKSALVHKFQATYKDEILSRKNEFEPAILHSRLKFFGKPFNAGNAAQAFKLDILLLAANELAFHADDPTLKRDATGIVAYYENKWWKLASTTRSLRAIFSAVLSNVLPQSSLDKFLRSLALFTDPAAVQTSLKQTTDKLRALFKKHGQSKPIFIIFDEIDLKLSQQKDSPRLPEYLDALQGLLTACSSFDDIRHLGIPIYPIVVLRSDIYKMVQGADHTKWKSAAAQVTCTGKDLKEILRYRLASELVKSGAAAGTLNQTFDDVWKTCVGSGTVLGNKAMITAVLERTFFRPRDIVYFLKLLATNSVKRPNAAKITPTDFESSREEYANYFLGELEDELSYLYAFAGNLGDVFFDIFFPLGGDKLADRNLVPANVVRKGFERFKKSEKLQFDVDELTDDLIQRSVFGVQVTTPDGPREFFEYDSGRAFRLKEANALCLHRAISDYFRERLK